MQRWQVIIKPAAQRQLAAITDRCVQKSIKADVYTQAEKLKRQGRLEEG